MNATMLHPGKDCVDSIIRLKEEIKKGIYKLPIYLIIVRDRAYSFTLKKVKQISILQPEHFCEKKDCFIVELLNGGDSIIINPHEYCSLKVSPDANGKAIFLSI